MVGGSSDPFFLVDPLAMSVTSSAGNNFTNNSNGIVYANGGQRIYLTSSITSAVTVMDVSGTGTPTMSPLTTFPGNAFGAEVDKANQILCVLADLDAAPTGFDLQLVGIDINLNSGSYGTQLFNSTTLPQAGFIERWNLSPSGTRAGVLQVFGNGLYIVDTDPLSATFLQIVDTLQVPGGGFLNARIDWAKDESQFFVVSQALGQIDSELARFDVAAGMWIDHDPATPGVSGLVVSPTEEAVFVSTINGLVSRIDYSGLSPAGVSITYSNGLLPQVWQLDINPDGTRLAGASWSPGMLNFWDAKTMTYLTNVFLNTSNIYDVRWR